MTCYVKFMYNLLVQPEVHYNFWGIILCNKTLPQKRNKEERTGTVH